MHRTTYTKDKLSLELITSPPRKKAKTTFGSSIMIQKKMKNKPT
jgi:hypothetical protein